jgi:hypothetical protein
MGAIEAALGGGAPECVIHVVAMREAGAVAEVSALRGADGAAGGAVRSALRERLLPYWTWDADVASAAGGVLGFVRGVRFFAGYGSGRLADPRRIGFSRW